VEDSKLELKAARLVGVDFGAVPVGCPTVCISGQSGCRRIKLMPAQNRNHFSLAPEKGVDRHKTTAGSTLVG